MKRSKHSTEVPIKRRKSFRNHNASQRSPYTLSVALPSSILDTTQNSELRTCLVGQVARALVIFNVNEVVVFDEQGPPHSGANGKGHHHRGDPNLFMCKILQFLETPQYLRKHLFPLDPDLKFAGLLNPLDCPHHMRQDDLCPYREGVVLEDTRHILSNPTHSLVDCGLEHDVVVSKRLEAGTRVTVQMDYDNISGVRGDLVPPLAPWTDGGLYWGYKVRLASSLGSVFTESPYADGYDLTIGTSERGEDIDQLHQLPPFRHVLVVLGGVRGLEFSLTCAQDLQVTDVSLLFHHYLNVCPGQGSRTIRTEEALLVVLSSLRPLLPQANSCRQ